MIIELVPLDEGLHDGTAVGLLDGRPLVYVDRRAHVDGRQLAHGDIAEALIEAVDVAASRILGPEWSKPLAAVTGLNARTCNRDRIRQWGLPPWVLVLLAKGAASEHPRAMGHMLMAVASLRGGIAELKYGPRVDAVVGKKARAIVEEASELIEWARKQRRVPGSKDPETES
ncbi:hypothetical protein [Methylobacterium sp. 391_Methyba4]|uniref:hypothetical protein n=1 Tax=Methylobacterium sp. 391_Methyba4 TaxID=3038924 RepID=UPI00241EBAFF|nr:hypothetical protein [Methylobacterium sp. 391_Methyba4]WFS10473.1 hypothetical protein P9K36_14835 [Methylobacterium sp. 391_Methyba4]